MSAPKRAVLLLLLLGAIGVVGSLRLVESYRSGFLHTYLREPEKAVLFVGDVMLARAVEDRIREVGEQDFFSKVRPLHEAASHVVVNFEATMQEKHVRSPDFTFRFSVDPAFVELLASADVTHASLANNHANDFGVASRVYAEGVLRDAGIMPLGMPRAITASSTAYVTLDTYRVALVAVEAVFGAPDVPALRRALEAASKESDYQVVYIHWGDEYQLHHNGAQEALARDMVSGGADAVVGHHPHVVQDIGVIDGVPIFYSLGNYVFDQYFDEDVLRGLALSMYIQNEKLAFELIPVGTDRSVPYVLPPRESKEMLGALGERSAVELRSGILRGTVSLGEK